MEIKIFCAGCKVEILRADTDTLKTPLIGNMFKVKKDMEWSLFSAHDVGFDLICPMCEFTFHQDGKVMVPVNGDFVFGKPEVIIPGIITYSDEFKKWEFEEGGMVKDDNYQPDMTAELQKQIDSVGITIPPIAEQNQKKINQMWVDGAIENNETPSPLDKLVKQVEGNKSEEPESVKSDDPIIAELQDAVETKEPEPEKPEPPTINTGDWSANDNTDGESEMNGKAPKGAELTGESQEMGGNAPAGTVPAESNTKVKIGGSKRLTKFFKKAGV